MREVNGLSELELLGLNLGERKRGTMLCLRRKEGRKAQWWENQGAQRLLGLAAPAWSSRRGWGDLKPVTYILGKGLEKTLR